MAIRIKLFDLLLARNISQRKFALSIQIRPNTINAYCHGAIKRIEIDDLNKICKELNCTISSLLEYIPDEE